MLFQLILEDEYRNASVAAKSEDLADLIKKAKDIVSEENFNNAYTLDDQRKDFSYYLVEMYNDEDQFVENVFFAGKKGTEPNLYVVDDNGNVNELKVKDSGLTPKFFIGNIIRDKKNNVVDTYYVEDVRKKLVRKFDHEELEGKGVLYIKKAK